MNYIISRYKSYVEDEGLDSVQEHIENDKIGGVFLYTTPLIQNHLEAEATKPCHVYVVFHTEAKRGKYWWSLEKNGEALILQWSRRREDVRDKIEGEKRPANKGYQTPQDDSSITFKALYSYIVVNTDLKNIKYNFAYAKCKDFAMIVFDKIAKNKAWNYVMW